jgi:uncharacterized integral membrane protein
MTAQTHQVEQPAEARKKIPVKTIFLVLVAILATLFAVKNWNLVNVWPLGLKPVTLVIGISFVLGGLTGWLVHSIMVTGRRLR